MILINPGHEKNRTDRSRGLHAQGGGESAPYPQGGGRRDSIDRAINGKEYHGSSI